MTRGHSSDSRFDAEARVGLDAASGLQRKKRARRWLLGLGGGVLLVALVFLGWEFAKPVSSPEIVSHSLFADIDGGKEKITAAFQAAFTEAEKHLDEEAVVAVEIIEFNDLDDLQRVGMRHMPSEANPVVDNVRYEFLPVEAIDALTPASGVARSDLARIFFARPLVAFPAWAYQSEKPVPIVLVDPRDQWYLRSKPARVRWATGSELDNILESSRLRLNEWDEYERNAVKTEVERLYGSQQ